MMAGWKIVVAVTAALVVAACTSSPPPPPATQAQPPSLDSAAMCLQHLADAQVRFERVKDWTTAEGCGVQNAVKVTQAGIPWNRPATLSCDMAEILVRFERDGVQPLARKWFNQSVRKIVHAGTYDCRRERGGKASRISQHGLGRAIDIIGFELTDGSVINVRQHWGGAGNKTSFLQDVSKTACEYFNVVLTPNRNEEHRDHLHLDIGPYKLCGY